MIIIAITMMIVMKKLMNILQIIQVFPTWKVFQNRLHSQAWHVTRKETKDASASDQAASDRASMKAQAVTASLREIFGWGGKGFSKEAYVKALEDHPWLSKGNMVE